MTSLKSIRRDMEAALKRYHRHPTWPVTDAVLVKTCSSLDNRRTRALLAKIVAVDQLYDARLIRYLEACNSSPVDCRPGYYLDLAKELRSLRLDQRFERLQETGKRLNMKCLPDIVALHAAVADATEAVTGRRCEAFAAKFLHFCMRKHFPVFDTRAFKASKHTMRATDRREQHIIAARLGFDQATAAYDRHCWAVLALQRALARAGLGRYTLWQIDKYLFEVGG